MKVLALSAIGVLGAFVLTVVAVWWQVWNADETPAWVIDLISRVGNPDPPGWM